MDHSICICMGSSCFARGNKKNLGIIESYLRDHAGIRCKLTGRCCAGKCRSGPNIRIDGIDYERMDPETLRDLLSTKLGTGGEPK